MPKKVYYAAVGITAFRLGIVSILSWVMVFVVLMSYSSPRVESEPWYVMVLGLLLFLLPFILLIAAICIGWFCGYRYVKKWAWQDILAVPVIGIAGAIMPFGIFVLFSSLLWLFWGDIRI
ncbi:MAG: hypothetical protein NC079_03030 [Clostridium sp.]|nr:hypothetical protein [Acetatifactor muris]MCM1525895.1 hypothetical protein [Bacteroides sp.]MCM1562565.1 hypothetical protein [Clostridium sp.]